MKLNEAIEQLEDLKTHCITKHDTMDPDSPWEADTEALDIALSLLRVLKLWKENDLSGMAVPSRSCNIAQDNCSTNKNNEQGYSIPPEKLESLLKIIDRNIESLENNFVDNAIYSLRTLRKSLANALSKLL